MLSKLRTALRALFRRSEVERELDDELRVHIEQQTEQNIRLGMNPEEARSAARKTFGGVEQAKERSRDARGVLWVEVLWQDLRYGLRVLRKNPGFTAATVLTLALGIGANTATFSVINAVLLRPLPFWQPDRLVHIWQTHPTLGPTQTTYLDYIDWRNTTKSFQGIAAYTFQAANRVPLTGEGEPEQIQATMVSHNLLSLVGIKMLQGRNFTADDEQQAARVVLISERLWRRKFSADSSVIGRAIRLGPTASTVIGVVTDKQAFPSWADIWMPLSLLEPMLRETRRFRPLEVIARLKDGVSVEEAHTELSTIALNIGRAYPETTHNLGASVVSLLDKTTSKTRPALFVVWMAVVRSASDPVSLAAGVSEIVRRADPEAPITRVRTVEQLVNTTLSRYRFALWLMIGFASLAAALSVVGIYGVIAFAVGRRAREFAVRAAIGARPADLGLLVLREGIVVSLVGLAVGLGLIWASSRLIRSVLFIVSPGDPAALAGAGLLIIALCVLSMLIPARRASSADPALTLKEG